MAALNSDFEALFLTGTSRLQSTCGHDILFFDHHFFHMAGVLAPPAIRLFMAEEKQIIKRTLVGFGKYLLDHNGSRARNLPSAHATLTAPDEVWEDHPNATSAQWVYIKEFASKPYPFTVALLAERPEQGHIIVPVSSFPCTRSDARKWRRGELIFHKQIQPPGGG